MYKGTTITSRAQSDFLHFPLFKLILLVTFITVGYKNIYVRKINMRISNQLSENANYHGYVCGSDGDGDDDDDDDALGENQEDLGKLHHSSSGHEG